MRRKRVAERADARINRASGGLERLLRLQHHRELREIETADVHQRAGALLLRDAGRVRKGVADLAQRHRAEWRRQIERRRKWRAHAASGLGRHFVLPDSRFGLVTTIT